MLQSLMEALRNHDLLSRGVWEKMKAKLLIELLQTE